MSPLARVNPQFVNIQGGTFKMGSEQWGDSQPIFPVTISSFQMMDAPVTVAQFKVFIEWGQKNNISHGRFIYGPDGHIAQTIWSHSIKVLQKMTISRKAGQIIGDIRQLVPTMQEYEGRFSDIKDSAERFLGDNKPVVIADWYEAAAFCAAIGWRLPTEAEHEYAARAGRKGDDVYGTDSGKLTAENARWDHGGSVNATADVRSYAPNLWGLHDMAGNVGEWCSNWSSADYKGWAAKDPVGPLIGGARALRSGSWHNDDRDDLLAAFRYNYDPAVCDENIGFRAVRRQGSSGVFGFYGSPECARSRTN